MTKSKKYNFDNNVDTKESLDDIYTMEPLDGIYTTTSYVTKSDLDAFSKKTNKSMKNYRHNTNVKLRLLTSELIKVETKLRIMQEESKKQSKWTIGLCIILLISTTINIIDLLVM